MSGVDKDFSYKYMMEGASISPGELKSKLKERIDDLSDIAKGPKLSEEGEIEFTQKENQNLKFDVSLDAEKMGGGIRVTGTIHRGLTGMGGCLICTTLGAASFMIMKNMEKKTPDELKNSLDNALEEIELKLKDEGKISESSKGESDALETLKKRFAEGEISEEEFKKKKEMLEE